MAIRVSVLAAALFVSPAFARGALPQDGSTTSTATGTTAAAPGGTADTRDLDAIVVTATRSEQALEQVPAAIVVRDMERLRDEGFMFGSDEYRGVTGVFFRRGEGDGDEFPFVSFRGSSGTDGSLSLVDGIPIVGLYEETQLNEIPYDAIRAIEIVKGPVSTLYGRGALYGVTNYLTRTPSVDGIDGSLATGSDGYARGDVSISRASGLGPAWLLSAAHEDYDGWRENGGRRLRNVFGKTVFALSDATTLTAYANVGDRASEMPNGIPLDADGREVAVFGGREAFLGYGAPRNDMRSLFTAAKLTHVVDDALQFDLTASYRDIDRDVFLNFIDPFGSDFSRNVVGFNGFRGDTTQRVWFGEATLRWRAGRHALLAGLGGDRGRIGESIRWSGQNGFSPECGFTFYLVEVDYTTGQVVNADHPCFAIDDPLTRDRFVNTSAGVFLQDEITLSDRWLLTVGGRFDRFSRDATFFAIEGVTDGGELRGDADAFSPKASLSFRPDWGQVYLSYGRGFNSNFGATFEWDPVQYARPESRPTTIDSVELGAKGRAFDDRLSFEAAVYYSRQKNRRQIIPNPDAEEDFTAPGNLVAFGDLYEGRGAELSAALRPRDGTELSVGYTRLDPEWKRYNVATFSGPLDFSGNTPVGVPDHIWSLRASQRLTTWLSLRTTYEAYGDYFYTVDNAFRDGGYALLTVGARIAPPRWGNVSIDVSLNNALDEDYAFFFGGRSAPTYAVPGPPRQLRVTLRGSF